MRNTLSPVPLSLYVHTPWCVQKCPYCDFNSHSMKSDSLPEQDYIKQLLRDFEFDLPSVWGRVVQTIFIGGGTPSLFTPSTINQLLKGIRARMTVKPDAEITLEANPGTVEQQRFEGFLDAGINRLSIGVQSFDPEQLKRLGRIHNESEALSAITAAKLAGFKNLNIDLMFGLPEQDVDSALKDLKQAIALEPNHISWYQLTLEPNTLFYHQPPPLPDSDILWDMQQAGMELLKKNGYDQYEVSAFCKGEQYSEHNVNYWQFGDYLGIGAGAHAKITDHNQQEVKRTWKVKHPKTYLGAFDNFIQGQRVLSENDLVIEFMMNALRLNRPLSFDLFEHRTGLTRSLIEPILERNATDGLISLTNSHFQTTPRGQQFLNVILEQF